MMRGYLDDLKEKKLLEEVKLKGNSKNYVLTEKGYKYLAEYQKVVKFVESFGLDED